MKISLAPILLSSILIALAPSCQKEVALPPKATGTGSNSANIEALYDVDKQIISNYKNWPFGKSAYQHTKNIINLGPRAIETKGHLKTQAYITKQLKAFGWKVSRQSFKAKTPYGTRSFVNIIARRKDTLTSPNIVLAAHYDSKILNGFIGADDAASSVASLLEIAENLPKQDSTITQQTELVFFDGEEAIGTDIEYLKDGLYGSIYYSKYMRNDVAGPKATYKHTPKFGILLDMIGHRNLSIKIPADTPYSLLKSYFAIVDKHNLSARFAVAKGSILDDHYPMNVIANLPTIDLIGDFSSKNWWHTNKDNLDNISENSLNVSIQVALEIIKDQLSKK